MKLALNIQKIDFTTVKELGQEFLTYLPKILGALAIVIIGWILIKFITYVLRKILNKTKVDSWADKLNEIEIFKSSNFKFRPSGFIVNIVKWFLLLILIVVVAEVLSLEMVSQEIGNLIRYLPKLFSAIAIFMIGVYIANVIKNAIQSLLKSIGLTGSNVIGNIAFYAITVAVAITALNQAGINTDIITNNLTIILGAFLLAFTIAFGLGSKNVIERLLFGFYSRKNLAVGQRIKVNGIEGVIESLDNICIVLNTADGKVMLPIKEVSDTIVEIKD